MIKNIIFDFGGVVLIHSNTICDEVLAETFSVSLERGHELWEAHATPLMEGKESSREFIARVKEAEGSEKDMDALYRGWVDGYIARAQGIDQNMIAFADALNDTYGVYLLTNTLDVHDEYNQARGAYDQFEKIYKSFEGGMRKPDVRIYHKVFEEWGITPEESVFIDDMQENVDGAKEAGMEAVLYTGLPQLKEDLKKLGVTVPE